MKKDSSIVDKTWFEKIKPSNISVQGKIISSLGILMLIAFITFFIVLNTYYEINKEKQIELISQMNKQAADSIEIYIQDLTLLTKYPLYDKRNMSLMVYMKNKIEQIDKEADKIIEDKDEASRAALIASKITREEEEGMANLLSAICSNKKNIYAAFLFENKGFPIVNYLPTGALSRNYIAYEEDWFNKSIQASGAIVISRSIPKMKTLPNNNSEGYVFAVSRAVKDLYSTDILGIIALFVDTKMFDEMFKEIRSIKGEEIYILDQFGNIIYSLNEKNIGEKINDTKWGSADIIRSYKKSEMIWVKKDKENYLAMPNYIETPKWNVLRVVSEKELNKNIRLIHKKLGLFVIGLSMFCLVVGIILSYEITKPMKKLLSTMKIVESGDLAVRFQTKGTDEVNQLGEGFNSMIVEVEDMINYVYIANYKKKEAELSALQAQINPHFIYNTLESIRMMAKINGDQDCSYMLSILGKLLRYGINTKKQIVIVKEEIDHLKHYMILQNHRFDNKFDLQIDINQKLMDISVIKLVFQPVVENAIYHALETVEGKGDIALKGYEKGDRVIFEIEDNGIGMTYKQLEILNDKINDFSIKQKDKRGIGLKNINERIKLYYGKQYGMKVYSEYGKGTKVILSFPERKKLNKIGKNLAMEGTKKCLKY